MSNSLTQIARATFTRTLEQQQVRAAKTAPKNLHELPLNQLYQFIDNRDAAMRVVALEATLATLAGVLKTQDIRMIQAVIRRAAITYIPPKSWTDEDGTRCYRPASAEIKG